MASLLERLRTAWNTLFDKEGKQLLLQGPLPLWMQERFEQEAERQGTDVGTIIFHALKDAALQISEKESNSERFKSF